jgi:hypothetical protein
VLPQKSTYFQPKLATGLVMARIDPQRGPACPSDGREVGVQTTSAPDEDVTTTPCCAGG